MKLEAKLEEQHRKREDDHELRMQQMFVRSLQQMMCAAAGSFQPSFTPPYSGPMQYAPTSYNSSHDDSVDS